VGLPGHGVQSRANLGRAEIIGNGRSRGGEVPASSTSHFLPGSARIPAMVFPRRLHDAVSTTARGAAVRCRSTCACASTRKTARLQRPFFLRADDRLLLRHLDVRDGQACCRILHIFDAARSRPLGPRPPQYIFPTSCIRVFGDRRPRPTCCLAGLSSRESLQRGAAVLPDRPPAFLPLVYLGLRRRPGGWARASWRPVPPSLTHAVAAAFRQAPATSPDGRGTGLGMAMGLGFVAVVTVIGAPISSVVGSGTRWPADSMTRRRGAHAAGSPPFPEDASFPLSFVRAARPESRCRCTAASFFPGEACTRGTGGRWSSTDPSGRPQPRLRPHRADAAADLLFLPPGMLGPRADPRLAGPVFNVGPWPGT